MPKTNFINGDAAQGVRGTRVIAEFLNAVNNHHHTGLDEDGHGALSYAADTGTENAYVVTLSPALSTYVIGMPIYFMASNTNSGASTINVNGLGAKAVKKNLIEDLSLGDIMAGDIVVVVFDGTNFQLIRYPQRDKLVASDIVQNFVVSGLLGTTPGGSITMTIPGGIAYVMGRRVVKLTGASDLTRTYTASRDTYVDISHVGAITYTEVANGAGAPSVTGNSIRLMKVVTDSTKIIGVTDLRTLTGGLKDSTGAIRPASATPAANTVPVSGADNKIVAGWGGAASSLATLDSSARLVEAANKISDGTNNIKIKIIDIGDWNMDASGTPVNYPLYLGVNGANIRDVSVHIRGDGDELNAYETENLMIAFVGGTAAIAGAYGVSFSGNYIALMRVTGGYFDNAQHDKTSYNRGWVTITYVE